MSQLRSATQRAARWIDDKASLHFRWILMAFNLFTALPVCYGVSFLGSPSLLKASLGLFTLLEVVIYRFVSRVPTFLEHKAFIDAYLRGPFNDKFKCPKVKSGSRVKQVAMVMHSLPTLKEKLEKSGAKRGDVEGWATRLERMALKFNE